MYDPFVNVWLYRTIKKAQKPGKKPLETGSYITKFIGMNIKKTWLYAIFSKINTAVSKKNQNAISENLLSAAIAHYLRFNL